jgi:hypothetical protein
VLTRKSELEEEYVLARPERLKDVWEQFTAASPPSQFGPWLSVFFGKVSELLEGEAIHASSLFGAERAPAVLCSLLQHALAPLAAPMGDQLQLMCKESPLPAADIYVMTDNFARTAGSYLDGCSSPSILAALTSLFAGFGKFLDSYGPREGNYLQAQLLLVLNLVTFDAQLSALGLGGDDEGFDGSGGVAFSDPLEAYEAFGERLVAAADSVYVPTEAAVLRSVTMQGGLRVKPVCRTLSIALSAHTKLLALKVDELRIACGFPSDVAAEPVRGKAEREGAEEDSEATQHAAAVAEGWARRLEPQDNRGRALVPCALRALQVRSGSSLPPSLSLLFLSSAQLSRVDGHLYKLHCNRAHQNTTHRGAYHIQSYLI